DAVGRVHALAASGRGDLQVLRDRGRGPARYRRRVELAGDRGAALAGGREQRGAGGERERGDAARRTGWPTWCRAMAAVHVDRPVLSRGDNPRTPVTAGMRDREKPR